MHSDGCPLMTMTFDEGTRERQLFAVTRVEVYFGAQGITDSAAHHLLLSYLANDLSVLEIVELLSRLLEGHPPFLLLEVAKSFFPKYTFECTLDPVPVRAITADGIKSLYQVAKEACPVDRRSVRGFKSLFLRQFEAIMTGCSGQPHILNVFNEIKKDYKRDLFGSSGFISRLMVLSRDIPSVLKALQGAFGHKKLRLQLLGTPEEPSPAFVTASGLVIEFLSKEGCRELLALIEYHRCLSLLTADTRLAEPMNGTIRELKPSVAYSRRLEYTDMTPGPRG